MHFLNFLALLAAPAIVTATLDPASSNTKGKCPSSENCSGQFLIHFKRKKGCERERERKTPRPNRTNHLIHPKQPQKYPQQSKPPNAPTTPAHLQPKPSQSSKQTTNMTAATAHPTAPAAPIPARLRQARRWSRTLTAGLSSGVTREKKAGMERSVSRIRIRGSVGARTQMGVLLLGLIAVVKLEKVMLGGWWLGVSLMRGI